MIRFELVWIGGTILLSFITLVIGNATNDYIGFFLSIVCMIWFFGCVIYYDKKPVKVDRRKR